jgi:hypothetical protein
MPTSNNIEQGSWRIAPSLAGGLFEAGKIRRVGLTFESRLLSTTHAPNSAAFMDAYRWNACCVRRAKLIF